MKNIGKLRIKIVCMNMAFVMAISLLLLNFLYGHMETRLDMENWNFLSRVIEMEEEMPQLQENSAELQIPYFVVECSPGERFRWISGNYYTLPESGQLQECIDEILEKEEDRGSLETYTLDYFKMPGEEGTRIAFVDYTYQRRVLEELETSLVMIGLGILVLVFPASLFLSKWMVKPVKQAWMEQKQFIADASHELKTPLTVISANAELLTYKEDVLGSTGSRWLINIMEEADSMKKLVHSLLTLAKRDMVEQSEYMMPTDMSELVQKCADSAQALYVCQNKYLITEIEQDVLVNCDPDSMKQLLQVLLENAEKYSGEQTQVYLSLTKEKKRECLLKVSNRGEEIPKEKREAIFRRFYRMDASREQTAGYGLGLSIAQSIVEAHHGKIWVESENGWNTFFVQLKL